MYSKFTCAQKNVITAPLAPIVVVAGAGSGKTAVLIARIKHLIHEHKIHPDMIWGITFTNKAADEVRSRLFEDNIPELKYLSTFHKSCVLVLRKYISYINRTSDFKILDQSDQFSLVKRIVKLFNNDNHNNIDTLTRAFADRINYFQKKQYFFNDLPAIHELSSFNLNNFKNEKMEFFYEVFKLYEEHLLRENLIDFNQILLYTKELIQIPEILEKLQNNFSAILIDEFQDTNELQLEIVSSIAQKHQNIFCVGDPDQSIFSFRGSIDKIFDKFNFHFPSTQIMYLNENFRCSKNIISVANKLIEHNSSSVKKDVFSNNWTGSKIQIYTAKDFHTEIEWIIEQIKQLKSSLDDFKYSDCSIFYRNNFISKAIEEKLIAANIPYILVNSLQFYERQEIKVIISYLYVLLRNDSISLEHIYNFPRRKISMETFEKISKYSVENNLLLFEAFVAADSITNLTATQKQNIKKFVALIEDLRTKLDYKFDKLIEEILLKTGYQEQIITTEKNFRFENIDFFVKTVLDKQKKHPTKSIHEILEECAVFQHSDSRKEYTNKVNLMTIHNSKGLEFKNVFISNLSEGVFPAWQSTGDIKAVEEERRIAYVAITRAKEHLFLSGNSSFDIIKQKPREISRFIWEIKKNDAVNFTSSIPMGWGKFNSEKLPEILDFFQLRNRTAVIKKANEIKNQQETYKMGQTVEHKIHGIGTVVEISLLGVHEILVVKFKNKSKNIEVIAHHDSIKIVK